MENDELPVSLKISPEEADRVTPKKGKLKKSIIAGLASIIAGLACALVAFLFLVIIGYYDGSYKNLAVNETPINITGLAEGVARNVTGGIISNILVSTNNCSVLTVTYQNFSRQLIDLECFKLVLNSTRG